MTSDLHLLTGAYAGGALTGSERDAFEEHLTTCAQCRDEVRELNETVALLGIAAAEAAPPGLRARVMAEVAQTRQLSPLVASLAEQAQRRKARLGRRWSLTAAACLGVFSIGLGAYSVALSQENSDLRRNGNIVAAVATAPDARTVTTARGDATAALTLSRESGQMVFVAHGLRGLKDDMTYQMWLLDADGTAHSAGTFRTTEDKHMTRLIKGPGKATAMAVTEEPTGGSMQPTGTRVFTLSLPRSA